MYWLGDVISNAYNSRSFIDITSGFLWKGAMKVKAYTDLTLSGNRHVRISGQALDLVAILLFLETLLLTGGES